MQGRVCLIETEGHGLDLHPIPRGLADGASSAPLHRRGTRGGRPGATQAQRPFGVRGRGEGYELRRHMARPCPFGIRSSGGCAQAIA